MARFVAMTGRCSHGITLTAMKLHPHQQKPYAFHFPLPPHGQGATMMVLGTHQEVTSAMDQMAKGGAMECIVTKMVGSWSMMILIVNRVLLMCLRLSHWVVYKMAFGIPQAVRSAEDQMAMDGVMERTVTKMDRSWHGMTGIVVQ